MGRVLLRRAIILLSATVVANAIPFFVALISIRRYSEAEFGYLAWLLSVFAILTIVFDLGLSNSIMPRIVKSAYRQRYVKEFLRNSIYLKCALGLLVSLLSSLYDPNLLVVIFSALLYSLIPAFVLVGMEKYIKVFLLVVIPRLFYLFLVWVSLIDSTDYVLYSLFISSILSVVLAFIFVRNSGVGVTLFGGRKKMLVYFMNANKGFFLSRTSLSGYQQGGGVVLGLFAPLSSVGYYYIAEQVYKIALTLLYPVSQALYATITKNKNLKVYLKFVTVLVLFSMIGAGVLMTFMSYFGWQIYGDQWGGGKDVLGILMAVFVVHSMTLFSGYPLYNLLEFKSFRYVNISTIVAFLVFISIVLFLNWNGSLEAFSVAVAVLISEFFSFLVRIYGVLCARH